MQEIINKKLSVTYSRLCRNAAEQEIPVGNFSYDDKVENPSQKKSILKRFLLYLHSITGQNNSFSNKKSI